MQAPTGLETGLKRDVAILSTLAHLHCGTVQHLHALCFPHHATATVRMSLHYLAAAGFVAQSPWQTKRASKIRGLEMSRERGQVWTLTPKGHDLLQQYMANVPPLAWIDLARPSTSLEHEEWRVRLDVRTFLMRLVLEARSTALLNCVEVRLPNRAAWPVVCTDAPLPPPDALVSILWSPAIPQAAEWLPWIAPATGPASMVHYPIYIERSQSQRSVTDVARAWSQAATKQLHIPVMIFQREERFASTYQQLADLPQSPSFRLATWTVLEAGIAQEQWRDERGMLCGLHPLPESAVN